MRLLPCFTQPKSAPPAPALLFLLVSRLFSLCGSAERYSRAIKALSLILKTAVPPTPAAGWQVEPTLAVSGIPSSDAGTAAAEKRVSAQESTRAGRSCCLKCFLDRQSPYCFTNTYRAVPTSALTEAMSPSDRTRPALKVPFAVLYNFPKWLFAAEQRVVAEVFLRQDHSMPGRQEWVMGSTKRAAEADERRSIKLPSRALILQLAAIWACLYTYK